MKKWRLLLKHCKAIETIQLSGKKIWLPPSSTEPELHHPLWLEGKGLVLRPPRSTPGSPSWQLAGRPAPWWAEPGCGRSWCRSWSPPQGSTARGGPGDQGRCQPPVIHTGEYWSQRTVSTPKTIWTKKKHLDKYWDYRPTLFMSGSGNWDNCIPTTSLR